MTFNFLGPGLTVNVEAKVKEQIILDSSDFDYCCRFLRRYDLQIEVLQRRLSPKLAAVRNTKGLRINVGSLQKSITLPLRNFVRPATND